MQLLIPIVLVGVLWVLLIRPQQRRLRAHQTIVASLQVGDEVITAGGMFGRITAMDDETIQLEVSPGTVMRILRGAVQQRIGPDVPIEPDQPDEGLT